ncbi:MAG: DUF2203 domain-containing protein [Pyrinomonadaceae bacterium]|jgi:hypothetical protein|nr:DUF2203 domain-containing protein [Pyrinomonadaceae bacterium]
MKLFSVEEANALLPSVRLMVERIQRAHKSILPFQKAARAAAACADLGGGGIEGGERYIAALMNLAECTSEMEALGVQIKDYARGLIDFPSLRENRVVLLCWQLGEPERIEWWHETEAGFAGRQPL